MGMNILIKNTMWCFFHSLSIIIFIFEPTNTNARNIDSEEIQHNVTFPAPVYNQSKAEEMCNKYIAQSCKTSVHASSSTCNSTKTFEEARSIVGGRLAAPKEYPHMALIYRVDTLVCGGSLISENFVLTAAHCAVPEKGINWIRLGELNLATDCDDAKPVLFSITNITVHPNYTIYENDIALLKFRGVTSFSDYIRPICLNTLENIPDQNFTAVGRGRISTSGPLSKDLRSVDLYPQNSQDCKSLYRGNFNNNTMICVGYAPGGKDTCSGDSGGPLLIENKNSECPKVVYTQIGITSFGEGCARPNTPGVYTKVSYFIPWIESIVWK